MKTRIKLLVNGENAFPTILEEIRAARQSVFINMFIWRDDNIGNTLAKALLDAADRGVQVTIIKDRYGILCEYSEEDQSSFFHKDPTRKEKWQVFFMKLLYQPDLLFKPLSMGDGILLQRMKEHPNITISSDAYRRDHSKFYIFDERTVILGGINVEDKETGADRQGRVYRDYMVRIEGAEAVEELRDALRGKPGSGEGMFSLNLPGKPECFGIRRRYSEMIHAAQEELTIVMAYAMPLDAILKPLQQAMDRGVKVRLLVPDKANFLNASNRAFAARLYDYGEKNGCPPEIYLTEGMTHIKAIVSERTISIGSANLTGKAFVQLGELNAFLPNDGGTFARSVQESLQSVLQKATPVHSRRQLAYSKFVYSWEKRIMSK